MKNIKLSRQSDGSMEDKESITQFLEANNISYTQFIQAGLTHGKEVKIVTNSDTGKVIKNTDGLITTDNIYLGLTVADCLPIFIYNQKLSAIIHAGWKGLKKGILQEANKKIEQLQADKNDLRAYIGPSIGVCHYEVKKDLIQKFSHLPNCFEKRNGKTFLNLKKIAETQLKQYNIRDITISSKCTYCDNSFFSYRRDGELNKMLAIIGPKK